MISMKKLRFSSRPSQSKSLAHGATGNCQRIALVSAVSLPQKSARSYLLGLNKFGVCSNFHCSFRCISKFWRSLPASFPCRVEVKGTTSSLCEWEAKPSLLRVPLRAARECLLKIFLKWRDRGLWTSSKLWCVCFGKVSIRQHPTSSPGLFPFPFLREKPWGRGWVTLAEVRLFLSVKLHEEQLKSNFTV